LAYKKKIILKAGDLIEALEISALHLRFEVTRDRQFKSNKAKIRIFNVTKNTTNNILKKGKSIVLEAGYEDEGTGVIYIGQITSAVPGYNGYDTYVDIESNSLQSSSIDLKSVTVSLAYGPNTGISGPIQEIANVMGLALYGIENVTGITLKNGYVFTGTPKQALRYCKEIVEKEGLIIFIDNDSLIISSEANPQEVTTTDLRPETGLLTASELVSTKNKGKKEEKKLSRKIVFKSILNPQIIPNKFVNVDNKRDINGLYVVDKCTFTGANYGTTPYVVRGEAIGV